MKLNLGGGQLPLDGFLNVDMCEGADIRHDLRNPLPFDEQSIDEIMAVHLIESFHKWELKNILQDWFRVLKPGGKLTIEFTDLDRTIALYRSSDPDKHRSGYWGLYGNQDVPVDPIVLHHFVWRLEDLAGMLISIGFSEVINTTDNILHNPERDFRLICTK